MQEVGRLTLNENPENKFNDDMQLGFSPARIVPGALGNLVTYTASQRRETVQVHKGFLSG